MNKNSTAKNANVFITVIVSVAVTVLLTVAAIMIIQTLPAPNQLKVALGVVFAIFICWLGFLKTYQFIEKILIKSRS